jgi:homocysteine S-methyltransferase
VRRCLPGRSPPEGERGQVPGRVAAAPRRPLPHGRRIETTLIFHEGLELPDFAAFHLLRTPAGEAALRRYFRDYAEIATRFDAGRVLETATWRANPDWGARLGYAPAALAEANRKAVELLESIRAEYETVGTPVVISGCVGPRGDGYVPDRAMTEQESEAYHRAQVDTFAGSAADMVCAITMNYVEEAVGISRAAARRDAGRDLLHLETDGTLPTGETLRSAIERVDAATSAYPAYYMVNCAHPTHIEPAVAGGGMWLERIRGLRANASRKSHAELNESADLDVGDPVELGAQYAALARRLTCLNVMGGCCGTDQRHVERIAAACAPLLRGR